MIAWHRCRRWKPFRVAWLLLLLTCPVLSFGHGGAHEEQGTRVLISMQSRDFDPETIAFDWRLEGAISVEWDPRGEKSRTPQYILTDQSGFTYVLQFHAGLDTNPWSYDGKEVAIFGEWTGEIRKLLDDGVAAEEILVGAIVPLNAPEFSYQGTAHVRSDAYWAEKAADYPAFEIVPKAPDSSPEERAAYGEWGPVLQWPHIPVSATNLPDGRILTWASNQIDAFPVGPEFTYAVTWEPQSGTFLEVPHESHDLFCGHMVILEDGRIFVNGGRNTVATTSVFNYQTNSWNVIEPMHQGRWYPTTVALPTSQVFTAIGSGGGRYPELWTPGEGWRLLTGIDLRAPILDYNNHYERNWWPLLHVAPDGDVIHTGPTPDMHRINTAGSGSIVRVGSPITEWYPKHGATVMFDEGLLLTAGGAISGSNEGSTSKAMVVDISRSVPEMIPTNPMNFARKFHNGVVLPDGRVLVIGGNTSGIKFNDSGTVLPAEVWDPVTGVWSVLADMAIPRNYHSVALLLTDGRVYSGGGGLCGNCAANHQNAQIFSPPYLFNADGTPAARPSISSAPERIGIGETFAVQATPGIMKFSLIKMSSTTHAVNTDQRFLNVPFSEVSAGSYDLTAHDNENVLTPGYYMLFAVDTDGVPSEAAVVQVLIDPAANRPPSIVNPGPQSNVEGASVNLGLSAYDPDGDPLSFSATGLPPGLLLDPMLGVISGALAAGGTFSVAVTVDDGLGETSTATFDWVVYPPGDGTGELLREWWTGISGTGLSSLTGSADYPDNPAGSDLLTTFEAPVNWADNYGTRIRGYLHPPVTGSYRFWIASDDNGELWLSTDEDAANAQLVALVPQWSSSRQWDKHAEQESAPIELEAGRRYYVEALQKEGGGGDNLAVAWEIPSGTREVIDGQFLSAFSLAAPNQDPTINDPGAQLHVLGSPVSLPIVASDPDGDPLSFGARDLPPGLTVDPMTGIVSGTTASAGEFTATVFVEDGNGGSASATFAWVVGAPLALATPSSPPAAVGSPVSYAANVSGGVDHEFSWDFGDGTGATAFSAAPGASHTFLAPGRFVVTLTVRDGLGQQTSTQFVQAIHEPPTANRPSASSTLAYEVRVGDDRVWNVNPDNDSVSAFNVVTGAKVAEISVGSHPFSLAFAPDGRLWVTSKRAATLSIIDPDALAVLETVGLPAASQPAGIVFDPPGNAAFIALEALGAVLRLDALSADPWGTVDVGPYPRNLSIDASGTRLLVSRFITPLLPGEATASPQVQTGGTPHGGEVVVVDATALTVQDTIVLRHSNGPDTESASRGIPNYLAAPAISPDGLSAWVPSKQDNILRGSLRDGLPLTHDSAVRSISSRIDLVARAEDLPARIDHDNGGIPSAALFGAFGSYLFVALEGSRQIAVVDPYGEAELFRFFAGLAPRGMALSPDGLTLYVHNFTDRTITVHDLTKVVAEGGSFVPTTAVYDTVASEKLDPQVLLGKQLFYDALDPRLGAEPYVSCASCHNDGGQDGRVWDFTGFGEGLRNTINLQGRGGTGHGRLHWSANFDEIQDFEGQIRGFAGGSGLMSDGDFHAGTRSQPLGDPKAGLSADLDALAAYVESLQAVEDSPARNADGSLTAQGLLGKAVFEAQDCAQCHSGAAFTDSPQHLLHDVGTIKASTGNRLGGPLTGLDTPTLRGLWADGPYLHDGSAATVGDAVQAHSATSLSAAELDDLVAYLLQIDEREPAPTVNGAPSLTNPGDQTHTDGDAVNLALQATDPDRDTLAYAATGLPGGLTIDGAAGVVSGTVAGAGEFAVTVTVDDGRGGTASASFNWMVVAVNRAPVLTNPGAQSSTDGDDVALQVQAGDPDGDALAYAATGLPGGLAIDPVTGLISGTIAGAGEFQVTVTVTDGSETGAVSAGFLWSVEGVNQAPVLTDPGAQGGTVTDPVSLPVGATDPDGDTLTYTATGLPGDLTIDAATGLISGALTGAGEFTVTVTVDDGKGGRTSVTFVWIVEGANLAPFVTNPGDQSNAVGDRVDLQVVASDPDGDALTYSATGLPEGLAIDPGNGLIRGTVSEAGDFAVVVTVTDEHGAASSDAFEWAVAPAAAGPRLQVLHLPDVSSQAWTGVTLGGSYGNPVAVCSTQYTDAEAPGVVRMRGLTGAGFEIRVQNPSDVPLGARPVHCVVAEEGVWELPDGRQLEARRYTSSRVDGRSTGWQGEIQSYRNRYLSPVVIGQVMSENDPGWSTFWSRGNGAGEAASAGFLYTGKHVGEDPAAARASELIGFLVIEAGSGSIDGLTYEAGLTAKTVDSNGFTAGFAAPFAAAPEVAVVSQSGMAGSNGGWANLKGPQALTAGGMELWIDEDQVGDSERTHIDEHVAYLVFDGPGSLELTESAPPPGPAIVKALETVTVEGVSSAAWTPVNLANRYTSLVAVCTMEYANNSRPAVIRMQNAGAEGFEIRLQSPAGSVLAGERVHCTAIEEGAWLLPDGRRIEAFKYLSSVTDHDRSWQGEARPYAHAYGTPVVFGQVMSFNDPAWSTFWTRGTGKGNAPSASALYVGKHVAEDPVTTRAGELVGYIVIEAGQGSIAGVPYEARLGADTIRGTSDHPDGFTYDLVGSFTASQATAIVAQAGMDGGNGGWAVLMGPSPIGTGLIRLAIEEDQLSDSERSHTTEQVGYWVIGRPVVLAN